MIACPNFTVVEFPRRFPQGDMLHRRRGFLVAKAATLACTATFAKRQRPLTHGPC